MHDECLQFGIRQTGPQLILEQGLAFRRRQLGEKPEVPGFERVFPELPVAQKEAQRRQPGEMPIEDVLQAPV
jgi:hypothetical protein